MSATTSKGIGNTTEAGGKRPKVYRYARLNDGMTVHPHGDWINYVDFDETAAELAALKASNAALVEALREEFAQYLEMLAREYPSAQSLGGTYLTVLLREKCSMLRDSRARGEP